MSTTTMGPTWIFWMERTPAGTARHQGYVDVDSTARTTQLHRNGDPEMGEEKETVEWKNEYEKEETSFMRRLKEKTAVITRVDEPDE